MFLSRGGRPETRMGPLSLVPPAFWSYAAQQTLKVRNVLSEVFADPMPKIALVRSLKINIGRRRKMQAPPKMIKETFIPFSEIYILLP